MSTSFISNVVNGDIIQPAHVNQYAQPANAAESGATWYREATNTGNAYKVGFATAINPVPAYTKGLIVHFKAAAANTGAATLTITGPSGDLLPAVALVKKGGTALAAGDIALGQVVAAIYTEDAGATNKRFEVIGAGLSSPVPVLNGGTGATTAAAARTALGTNDAANITAGILVAARGGFGGLTNNAIPKASATGAVASALSDDGTSVLSLGRKVGIGATTFVPARSLHVIDAANPQQRWERTSVIYSEMQVDANGGVLLSLTGTSVGLGGTHTLGESLAAGKGSSATALGGMAVGYTASVTANYGIALGHGAISSGGIALGRSATNATFSNCMAFGTSAANTAANQVVFGSSTSSMDAIYAGKGVLNATPTAWALKGTGGLGTNIAGGGIDIDAGAGTGTGASGTGRLRATAPGSTGTTLQTTYSNSLSWSHNKLGFYGATPVVRAAAIPNATDAATAISQLNLVLAALRAIGIVSP